MKLFIKRLLLILIGIFLSLVVLECGLRLAGWTISSYQQYKNNKALRNKAQYTIMCLGESTTAGQYPIQLQQILDKKYPNKFSIIDCGIPGTNLESILNLLDNNINKYKFDISICMMGINNDLAEFTKTNNTEFYKKYKNINLKIYKLFILLKLHLKNFLSKNIIFAQKIYNEKNLSVEDALILRKTGKFKEAEKVLKNILETNPNNEIAFLELSKLYSGFLMEKTLAYNMAVTGLKKNFNYEKEFYYEIIFEMDLLNKNFDSLKYYIKKVIDEDIVVFSSGLKYSIYGYIKNYITEEQRKKILNEMISNSNNDMDYGLLAIEAIKEKDYQKSKKYFDKAEEIRLNFPNRNTYKLYKFIIKKLLDNNIKVICMQYPVRSILPLQQQLKNESYYDKLTFISNEENFKYALMNHNYDKIFQDRFAGDFGHCTDLGNTLIAENVVKTLENILNLKEN